MSAKMNDIDNTKLEEAMALYTDDPGKDNLIKLVMAIRDTKLFVPAMAVPEKGGFQPYVIKNPEGDMYMPAFTAQDKFPKDQKYQGMLKLPYKQCASMLLDNPTLVQGIALNPFTQNLLLKTQMLELTRKVEQYEQSNRPKAVSIKSDDFRMVTRHNTEFHQIPERLYKEKLAFIEGLTEETLCEMYKVPYKDMGQENHYAYTKDDFELLRMNIRDDLNIIQIVTPTKNLYQTNCRELYIVWNPQTERICYYMVEKGTKEAQKQYLLDTVKADGSWERLGEAPAEGNVINRVMELFEAN